MFGCEDTIAYVLGDAGEVQLELWRLPCHGPYQGPAEVVVVGDDQICQVDNGPSPGSTPEFHQQMTTGRLEVDCWIRISRFRVCV